MTSGPSAQQNMPPIRRLPLPASIKNYQGAALCPLIIYTECHCQPLSIGLSLINYYQLQLKGRSCPLTRDCLVPSQPSCCTLSTGSEPQPTSTGLDQELPMTNGGTGSGTHSQHLSPLTAPSVPTNRYTEHASPSLTVFGIVPTEGKRTSLTTQHNSSFCVSSP